MSNWDIPFNKPYQTGNEAINIQKTFDSGHTAGVGQFTVDCEKFLESETKSNKVLLTTSCTSALEMSSLLINLQPGDEVILPSFTFVTTATAFHLRGVKLRFCDIRPDTLNIDESKIEELVNENTKLIVPVHYGGVACDMDAILSIASDNNLFVIEDAAHAIGAKYKNNSLGTIGDIGAFSFHETKNIICGEGGAISVNNFDLLNRADLVREKGTNRTAFLNGSVDKYTWVDTGSSYAPSEIMAAFLSAQLDKFSEIFRMRENVYLQYHEQLADLESNGLLRRPYIPPECTSNYHNYFIILNSSSEREALIKYLAKQSIMAVTHYVPLHSSPMGLTLGYLKDSLPITEDLSSRLLRLPFYNTLTSKEIEKVTNHIHNFFSK